FGTRCHDRCPHTKAHQFAEPATDSDLSLSLRPERQLAQVAMASRRGVNRDLATDHRSLRLKPRPHAPKLLRVEARVGLDVVEERRSTGVEERNKALGVGSELARSSARLFLAAEP